MPVKYLKHPFDLEEVNAGNKQMKPIGYQYHLVTRCLQRYLINQETNYGDFLTKFEKRWGVFQDFLQNNPTDSNLQSQFIYLDSNEIIEASNWDEFTVADEWEQKQKLALNITGCLPDTENQEMIFNCILRGGVPISLWHKCQGLTCEEIRQEIEKILTIDSLKTTHILLENLVRTRQKAHTQYTQATQATQSVKGQHQQVKASDYFGYHLGFLYDHPYRVPAKFNYAQGGDALSGYD